MSSDTKSPVRAVYAFDLKELRIKRSLRAPLLRQSKLRTRFSGAERCEVVRCVGSGVSKRGFPSRHRAASGCARLRGHPWRQSQSESCDTHGANLIVHVATAPAPEQDIDALGRIRQGLAATGLHPVEHYAEQETPGWKKRYAIRAGCEATVSETVHAHGLRHSLYKGLAKTHVQHVLTAAGINIARLFAYDPPDEHPRPGRCVSHLQRLCQQLATRQAAQDHQQHRSRDVAGRRVVRGFSVVVGQNDRRAYHRVLMHCFRSSTPWSWTTSRPTGTPCGFACGRRRMTRRARARARAAGYGRAESMPATCVGLPTCLSAGAVFRSW
jgi:hypothetical protein